MPDVFISYSAKDEKLANWLYRSCNNLSISSFMAPISIDPGVKWKQVILNNLRGASWFFFLATPNSIQSDAVKHEIGGALLMNKNIVPILYDIEFSELPDWIKEYQGVKITNTDATELLRALNAISGRIKADNLRTILIVAALLGVAWYFGKDE
jgi:hypothetical protein